MSGRPAGRRQGCGKAEARTRLSQARAFADTAALVLDVPDEGSDNVAASLSVLAEIAASDAACCAALGQRSRGQDHREALAVLSAIAEVGPEMAKNLARLLDVKDNAQYGVLFVSATVASQSVKWAQRIVDAAESLIVL